MSLCTCLILEFNVQFIFRQTIVNIRITYRKISWRSCYDHVWLCLQRKRMARWHMVHPVCRRFFWPTRGHHSRLSQQRMSVALNWLNTILLFSNSTRIVCDLREFCLTSFHRYRTLFAFKTGIIGRILDSLGRQTLLAWLEIAETWVSALAIENEKKCTKSNVTLVQMIRTYYTTCPDSIVNKYL